MNEYECVVCSEQKEQHAQILEIEESVYILGTSDHSWESTHQLAVLGRWGSYLYCVVLLLLHSDMGAMHQVVMPGRTSFLWNAIPTIWTMVLHVFGSPDHPRGCVAIDHEGAPSARLWVWVGRLASPSPKWWAAEGTAQSVHHQQNSLTPCSSLWTGTQTSRLVEW